MKNKGKTPEKKTNEKSTLFSISSLRPGNQSERSAYPLTCFATNHRGYPGSNPGNSPFLFYWPPG